MPGLTSRLMRAMVLFDEVVEVLALPQFTGIWHDLVCFQFPEGFGIGSVFIDGDDAREDGLRGSKRLLEKPFDRLSISCLTQKELERVSDGESTAR
jgi:hypothetical protein